MIKKYNKFIKESFNNRGKGPVNDDFIPSAPIKQTLNRSNQTLDLLRVGKQIKTKNIDGIIDSIQKDKVLIYDRLTSIIKVYGMKEFFKEISKYKDNDEDIELKGFTGVPKWAENQNIYENLENEYDNYDDVEDINIKRKNKGTEDNPDGLPNDGLIREMPDPIQEKYIRDSYNNDYDIEEEDDDDVIDFDGNYYPDRNISKLSNILADDYVGLDYKDDDLDLYNKIDTEYKRLSSIEGSEDNPI